jgi:hypothetical protein
MSKAVLTAVPRASFSDRSWKVPKEEYRTQVSMKSEG